MTILPCTPTSGTLTWSASGGSCFLEGLPCGTLAEALADHAGFVEVVPSKRYTMQLAVVLGKKKLVKVYDPPFRYILPPADWMDVRSMRQQCTQATPVAYSVATREPSHFIWTDNTCQQVLGKPAHTPLGIVAQACGLRRLTDTTWHMCAPNAVLHPQMGPCVTMCTDGVHVVLWDKPWPGSVWHMAHVSNITGPVTSTPTATWEWCGKTDAERIKVQKDPLDIARRQLEKALANMQIANNK